MSRRNLYDVQSYIHTNWADPYEMILFIWMLLSCIFNAVVIAKSLNGWLINPKITRQVVVASSVSIIWILMFLIQFFVKQRAISIIGIWTGQVLTLLITLQHLELLKLFVVISDFWTIRKCRNLQQVMVILHVLVCFPTYIWPLGLENDAIWTTATIPNLD